MPTVTTENQTDTKQLIDRIIERHRYEDYALIGVLQDAQKELNWLPQDVLKQIAEKLNIPLSRVYAIATFYKAFSLKPRGKHLVCTCLGTACHVRGSPRTLNALEQTLRIKAGETTPNMEYTLETVNCLGACALGPVVVVDGEYHRQMTPKKVNSLLKRYS